MTEEAVISRDADVADDVLITRIYEVGYHIIPTVTEENVEKMVGDIRAQIEQGGGSFIAEGAPTLMRLSYNMPAKEGDKWVEHDRGYFGWLKFESTIPVAQALEEALKTNPGIMRHMLFQTVREETRARMKAPTLREVKRTDIIKSSPRREKEESAPISEVDLDKAILDITTD